MGLDEFRRTEGVYEEGTVSWWVESVEHPPQGKSKWTHFVPALLVPPTPSASILDATTATHLSESIQDYDSEKSSDSLSRAFVAMRWTNAHENAPDVFGRKSRSFCESLAYAHLYPRTGEKIWYLKQQL